MVSLARDWLLDPTALLFLLSMLFGLCLLWRAFRRRRHRSRDVHRRRGKSRGGNLGWVVTGLLIWISAYLLSSAPFVVNHVIATLENQHPTHLVCPSGSHLIVLSGGVDSRILTAREFNRMSPATIARATSAAHIVVDEPDTKLIVAGGVLKRIAEAEVVSAYLQQLGIDERRIVTEVNSINTRENAINVAQLLIVDELTGPVRLVTSAMHMPRALGTFQKVLAETGIDVCPVSVDVQMISDVPAFAWMPQITALMKFDLWFHEVFALIHYRYKGWV